MLSAAVVLQIWAPTLADMKCLDIMRSVSYNLDKNLNKATIVCEIEDFKDLRRRCTRKEDFCTSEKFFIGRSSFSLDVYPIGGTKKEMMSIYLCNCSDHSVVVDFSIKGKGVPQHQQYGCKLEGGDDAWGLDIMRQTKLEGSLKLNIEVTLKSEALDSGTTETGTTSNVSGAEGLTSGLKNFVVESEGILNQTDIHLAERLEERLDKVEIESVTESKLSSQLADKEAKLQELWNNDRSFIQTKGKEMSDLLSKLEDTEEEKAGIEKKVAEVDATVRELQERRDKLVLGIRDKDEKIKKFLKKKNKLENFIEEQVGKSRKAKHELEREILDIKRKLEDLSKANSTVEERPEGSLRLKWLESIESRIENEEKELECPICLEVGRQ